MVSGLGAFVRRHDPDRFFCSLFAPEARRESLFVLYAFNHELARAAEVTREPMMALIRLQWWREVVEGARRAHPVAMPLRAALDEGALSAEWLLPLIDARESELDAPFPTISAWLAYLLAGAGGLAVAAGAVLGADMPTAARLRCLGAAYGAAGTLALAASGRMLVPEGVPAARLAEEAARLRAEGGGRFQRAVIAAALPAILSRHRNRRGLLARLDVVAAGLRLRVC